MRRNARIRILWLAASLGAIATLAPGTLPVLAQQAPINPRVLPPPPPPDPPALPESRPVPAATVVTPAPPAAQPRLTVPETVVVAGGTRIAVVLDTPLSTRISNPGQLVNFRTSEALPVAENLALPPETIFSGKVVEAHRPGAFGKGGALRVHVERIELPQGGGASVVARLDSTDLDGKGRVISDNNRTADLFNLATWTAQGTLLGAHIHGGKGAAVGAGAGAAIALLIMMSRRGQDVYLEPGTPFLLILDEPLALSGASVLAAQQAVPTEAVQNETSGSPARGTGPAVTRPASGATAGASGNSSGQGSGPNTDPATDPDRPKLKHRPKPIQP